MEEGNMGIEHWIMSHKALLLALWLAIQTILKAVQDAIDAEPIELKTKPFARISYYMQAISGYLLAGNRIKSIGGQK